MILTKCCDNIYRVKNKINYENLFNDSKTYQNNPNLSCIFYNTSKDNYTINLYNKLLKTDFIPYSISFFIDDTLETLLNKGVNLKDYVKFIVETMNSNGIYISLTREPINKEFEEEILKRMSKEITNDKYNGFIINIYRLL